MKKIFLVSSLIIFSLFAFKASAATQIGNNTILTSDMVGGIEIISDNIIFDCAGHHIIGSNGEDGFKLDSRQNVTIKNCVIDNVDNGFRLTNSSLNKILNNIISSNRWSGLYLTSSNGNTIEGNSVLGSTYGSALYLAFSNGNIVENNSLKESSFFDIFLYYTDCSNVIRNNTGSGNLPIKYFNSSTNLDGEVVSELILCNADNSRISNVTITGSAQLDNNGILVSKTDNTTFDNVNSSDNAYGIFMWESSNYNTITSSILVGSGGGAGLKLWGNSNNISKNIISKNVDGIDMYLSSRNIVTENIFDLNHRGIYIQSSNNNNFTDNKISSSDSYGIYFYPSSTGNIFSRNNLINNPFQIGFFSDQNNTFNLDLPVGGNYWDNYDTAAEGCYDNNSDNICDTPYAFASGQDNLPWKLKDGWLTPAQPLQFFSQIQNSPSSTWNLRSGAGLSEEIIKTLPNGWAVKVLNTTQNGTNADANGYRWYYVQDMTDGAVGWMAAKNLSSNTEYLAYDPNNQNDLQGKSETQITTREARASTTVSAVNNYFSKDNSDNSLYGGGGGKNNSNNFQNFIQGSNFPKELALAITAQESSIIDFNNEHVSHDFGHGAMQITFKANVANYLMNSWDNRSVGSDVIIPKCRSIYSNNYKDCYANSDTANNLLKSYKPHQDNPLNVTYKQYSNTFQSFYANVKDGLRVLQDKYRHKCSSLQDQTFGGYTFTCQDIEKVLGVWAYNGIAKDKSGQYTGNYLKYVAGKLRSVGDYFTGMSYANNDNLVEKLEVASNNKQVAKLYSPGYLQVVDQQGRVTGLVNNENKEDIPNSLYDSEAKSATVFFPNNINHYRVVGTDTGEYGLSVNFTDNGIEKTFNASAIPTTPGETHDYYIDWTALVAGERGVTLMIDKNGDGVTDLTIISDSYLYDIEPPTVTVGALQQEYLLNSYLNIEFSATDNVSGLANISATLNDLPVNNGQSVILDNPGVNTLKVTAVDNDGNITISTTTFRVIYGFIDFLPPIKTDGSGIYNQGKTLPIKFQLTDNNGLLIPSAINHIYVAKISSGIVGTDEVPLSTSSADTGNQFRYDLNSDQYIYNLDTSTLTAGSWQLKAELDDGKEYNVIISIR